jgi:hypothetical protein
VTSGEDDAAWMMAELVRRPCDQSTSRQNQRCVDDELRLSGVGKRIAHCRDLSWLP